MCWQLGAAAPGPCRRTAESASLSAQNRQSTGSCASNAAVHRHNASTPGMVAQRRVWQLAEQRTAVHELCHHKHQAMRPTHANQLQAGAEPKRMSWLWQM